MWYWIICAAMVLGVVLIYLSHRNQRVLEQTLSIFWSRLAKLVLLGALLGVGVGLSQPAATFTWLVMLMVLLMLVPMLGLALARRDQ